MKRGGTWKEEVKGIGKGEEGGGIEGGGREKSSNCTLSLKGAKNFIPGKALFFLSLENSASTPLIAAAVHTHTATFTRPYVKTDAVFCRAQLDPPRPPRPARCCPPWASPNSKHSLPWSRLEQTKSAAQGWPGSSLGGSSLARNAGQWTRPNMHRLQLQSTHFFFPSFPFYLPCFMLSSYFHSIYSSLPSSFRTFLPYCERALSL